ncbi:glycosyltransferase family 1 protein [Algoriphagus sp. NG3]|uniref:glycosyltransferase family 4 protein n=1 Tax=Algoriphagus sp. NG3 TaxID=3097546 RepID=UPI002A81AB7F|nr:glycosyltransferase family 1 protein [Algoriphagus sp. NG3]WPR74699.1 glycosyltransferase family 1 protein [Algoriphagus sp. NG3]
MKVLLDLQYLNVATTGIKTYMMELARAAMSYPHPDIVWIFSHDPETQSADQTFKDPKSKIQRLNYHLDYFRWKEFQLPDLIKKHQPDVLICPDFVSPAASLPCRRLTVIHDAFFWQMPQNYPKWWRTYFLRLIKKGLKENTEIITTTEYSRKSLYKHLKKIYPMTVIHQVPKKLANGVDTAFLEKHSLENHKYLLHIGTFDKRKHLPLLVRAFGDFLKKANAEFKLVLAGGAGQSVQMNDKPVVDALVAELGLQDSVILPGYVSDAQVRTLYEGAFAYVFPSENEGFGIPIVEAMTFGVPVIHSDQPALLEVAGDAGLSFNTGNQQDLTEKMILLSSDFDLRSSLLQKGFARSKDFSSKKFIEAFHQVLLSN